MMKTNSKNFRLFVPGVLLAVSLIGCTNDMKPDANVRKIGEALGETSTPYHEKNVNLFSQISPSYIDRVFHHYISRTVMSPATWGLANKNGPFQQGEPPLFSPSFRESAQWLSRHKVEYDCNCKSDQDPSVATRACCILKYDANGYPVCEGERIDCNSDQSIEKRDSRFRMKTLIRGDISASGESPWITYKHEFKQENGYVSEGSNGASTSPLLPGAYTSELYGFILAGMFSDNFPGWAAIGGSTPAVYTTTSTLLPAYDEADENKKTCFTPKTHCNLGGGTCKTLDGKEECDPEAGEGEFCKGVCNGGQLDGIACSVPRVGQPICKLDPKKINYSTVTTRGGIIPYFPIPRLSSGIAASLRFEGVKVEPYLETAEQSTDFSVIYYEFDDTKKPKQIQLIVDGQCIPLDNNAWDKQKKTDNNDKYVGQIYTRSLSKTDLTNGCHKYYFTTIDSTGRKYTYPEYGSLGIAIKDGAVDLASMTDLPTPSENTALCNSFYVDQREIPSCVKEPTIKVCQDGEVRPCYTGDQGNLQKDGYCQAGSEKCVKGAWSGVCENQVLPMQYENCNDPKDNNCNNVVNENCPVKPESTEGPGKTDGDGNGGTTNQNPSNGNTPYEGSTTEESKTEKKKSGCSSTGSSSPSTILSVLFALLGITLFRRRKE